ncbi:UDP-glucose 4-epimerase GalE [Fictibacillus norfolkensis]|uniref:UDP-glucose 4-epimerase n=1 Tax=Fictibacillus norfolkensis TaxID=2762233 RepID=A0ABR8SID7_9BACL|nr:UDP-glucose 4-epimerase GalE [Fictibacillus norfolkensis]MBD7963195.1 UDP-glucose 4-epimerase GalE [Fictibacillus norfolkensis]
MAILVTGGAGYIGSHTAVELIESGYEVVIVDNFMNSSTEVINRLKKITGKEIKVYNVDLLDKEGLTNVFSENQIEAVIHFAGLKAVGESVEKPLFYYHNNITGTLHLSEVMKDFGVKKMVFSSSATVYGTAETVPLNEDTTLGATNPYGWSKLMLEQIFRDLYTSDNEWSIALLRYFNPVGAHESGLIGEDPNGIPNNLTPFITQVAVGKLEKLRVFGNDYDTEDGTGVRDYIHVVDLAKGHLKALDKVLTNTIIDAYNLGTGEGYSVLEMVNTFEKVTSVKIPYEITDRRPGDIAVSYADPTKARQELGWVAERGLEDMLRDSWNWQQKNKNGYEK